MGGFGNGDRKDFFFRKYGFEVLALEMNLLFFQPNHSYVYEIFPPISALDGGHVLFTEKLLLPPCKPSDKFYEYADSL